MAASFMAQFGDALVANGWPALAWAYLLYTVLNMASAWLILSGRV